MPLLFLFIVVFTCSCSQRETLLSQPIQLSRTQLLRPPQPREVLPSNPPQDPRLDCNAPIQITEIHFDPKRVPDRTGEFIELYNAGETAVSLNGWRLTDMATDSHVITANPPLILNSHEFLVVAASRDKQLNGGIEVQHEFDNFQLSNHSDRIRLEDPCGNAIFDLSYPLKSGWPKHRSGRSIEQRANPHKSSKSKWRLSRNLLPNGDRATPGFANWRKEKTASKHANKLNSITKK